MTYIPGQPLPWFGPLSGAGPHALKNNAVNLYNDSAADAFTMNMPANPADGDEVWLCEIGGLKNPVTVSGNGNNLTEWSTINPIVASVQLASENLVVGYKFLAAFSTWKAMIHQQDGNWNPANSVGSPGPHTLTVNEVVKYEGAGTFQINLHGSPVVGEKNGVAERDGSGSGTVTISGNGTNLVNDAGASAPSMTLSSAYAYRQWRFDPQVSIWLMTHKVN